MAIPLRRPDFIDERVPEGIDRAEWQRRFWHIAPGLLPFALRAATRGIELTSFWRVSLSLLLTGWLMTVLFSRARFLRRQREASLTPSILGYALPVGITLALFPAHLEIGFTVLVLLAFCDGLATIAGRSLPRHPLPWNPRKTWAGFLSFVAGGGLAAALVYRQEIGGAWLAAGAHGLILSGTGALAESWPSQWNDNLRVALAAAVLAIALYGN